MATVADVLDGKGRVVYRIDGGATVLDAVRAMVDANVGALLVGDGASISGIVTERDYLRRVTLEGRDERETEVREIMSAPLVIVTPDTPLEECMALMTDRRIRHLPVLEHGEIAAVISIGDLVKYQSQAQSFELRYLHDYINAR